MNQVINQDVDLERDILQSRLEKSFASNIFRHNQPHTR